MGSNDPQINLGNKPEKQKTIIRIKHITRFTVLSNSMLNDRNLSLKAKGLLAVLLSKPDDWIICLEALQKELGEGRDSISSAMKELNNECYISIERKQGENGRFTGFDYQVFEERQPEETINRPNYRKPSTEKPCTASPYTENQQLLNTDLVPSNNTTNEEEETSSTVGIIQERDPKTTIIQFNRETGSSLHPVTKLLDVLNRLPSTWSMLGYLLFAYNALHTKKQEKPTAAAIVASIIQGEFADAYSEHLAAEARDEAQKAEEKKREAQLAAKPQACLVCGKPTMRSWVPGEVECECGWRSDFSDDDTEAMKRGGLTALSESRVSFISGLHKEAVLESRP